MEPKSIAEQIFFTTVRIDTVTMDGQHGSGTGFYFAHQVGEKTYLFIVTNKHVVLGMKEGVFTFIKQRDGLPVLGDGFQLNVDPESWSKMWVGHPDQNIDIVICPLVPLLKFMDENHGVSVYFRAIYTSMIPTQLQLAELDSIESVTFVGYPNGVWDRKNLLPVARRGTTASPLSVDFEGSPRFLIDASVFGGSSGSPVFILNQGTWAAKSGATVVGSRLLFVGVVAAVFFRTQLNKVVAVPIPTQTHQMAEQFEMIDLGIVFKSQAVLEIVEIVVAREDGFKT